MKHADVQNHPIMQPFHAFMQKMNKQEENKKIL
jgi:hypothetical protein